VGRELSEALSRIKKLSGPLPICASWKRIRDDKGNWHHGVKHNAEVEFGCAPRALRPGTPGRAG
jgi:hypothetical protein